MLAKIRGLSLEIMGALLLGTFVVLLLGRGGSGESGLLGFLQSPSLLDVKTLFLSILLEAIPFVLLGVFFSAFIQTFVSEEQVRRWTPRHPLAAIPFAGLLGILFPVCECAIIPVVRRLIQKGMPVHVGIVFLLAGPVVNPVVFTSTVVAFQRFPDLAYYRVLAAFLVAVITGVLIFLTVKKNPLRIGVEQEIRHETAHAEAVRGKLGATLNHAVDEFFDMGKYLLFGALISSVLQVWISRETLLSIGQTPFTSHLVMMGMAYVFSLCSEADAFIAASFANTFHASSLLAFLVYGPMLDLKSTMMLFGSFRFGFVVKLLLTVTLLVLAVTLLIPV
ncbi:permease [Brevibacillus borstelensis]|uniref:permease n=1 Tax=Brevibacillus borstelensis TaxID=45462 RepID=UPI00149076D7|nr:permease [Brevibacillus borstelensis]MED1853737.1 permease [Brevibacillus borstelensis]NOU57002.1 permease [Brevibacillus borstelensis]